jgi:tyrosine aminotransferase
VGSSNGYLPSSGSAAAKKAISQYNNSPGYTIHEEDVIIGSGCSGALDLVLSGLINEGDNILVPKPAFPLYQVITESLGGHVKYYPLKADCDWECDLDAMDAQVDSRTRAILINNPSNPCGSNFSAEHLLGIAAVARKHGLLIIADEIYGKCVFEGEFFPMHLYSGDVPVVSVGGLAKEFIVPGWRVGWLIFHDKGTGRLDEYKTGVRSLTQITLGASSLLQAALPHVLCATPGSKDANSLQQFLELYMRVLSVNGQLCVEEAKSCPELSVIEPKGAMYTMIRIEMSRLEGITDDADFARKLLEEENLFILPGACFNMPNFVRLVICPPAEIIQESFARLRSFCERYRRKDLPPLNMEGVAISVSAHTLTDGEEDDEEVDAGSKAATIASSAQEQKRRRVSGSA